MTHEAMKKYAPAVVRIGLGLVFLWFGISQISAPADWAIMIPAYATKLPPFSPETLITLHGSFEIIFGALLFVGFKTRLAAFLLALNLANITFLVGYNAIGVRDFGLLMATVSIVLRGADSFTLDSFLEKKKVL